MMRLNSRQMVIPIIGAIAVIILGALYGIYSGREARKEKTLIFPGPDRYTVQSGDSLFGIAQKYGLSVTDLKAANALDTAMISPGQVLTIPAGSGPASSNSTVNTGNSLNNGGGYMVRSGDSLYSIAQRFGVTVAQIKQSNGLKSEVIFNGQVLTIPGRGASENSASGNQYTVKAGDCLYSIAAKYGTTITAIRQANGLSSDTIQPGQILKIPAGRPAPAPKPANGNETLARILAEKGIPLSNPKLRIEVDKSAKTLTVYSGNIRLKNYPVELGDGGPGDKKASGDHKTPEGTFYITETSVLNPADEYLGSRWMRLSYPNIEDAARGLAQNLIDQATYNAIVTAINRGLTPPQWTALGGGIGIHGGDSPDKGGNWTWGCVGLTNKNVEELFNFVTVGTPVIIYA